MNEIFTYLSNFQKTLPPHRFTQGELIRWINHSHAQAEKLKPGTTYSEKDFTLMTKFFERYAVKETQISQRYLEISDGQSTDLKTAEIYKVTDVNPTGANILERTMFFSKKADAIIRNSYENTKEKPDHLIHVTCTGYISPSPVQKVVAQPSWQKSTGVTHAYHMGCYASLPAIRIAQGLMAQNSTHHLNYTADIFHTEMCSLHMNTLNHTPEQIIVQTLFADGHIKYTAQAKPAQGMKSLKVLAIHEKIIPESSQDMSWLPTPWGMQMNLSREVPQKIKEHLKDFLNEMLETAHLGSEELKRAEFAIHPGGPKIIDTVKEFLELDEKKVAYSKKILFERGNMSSATLPHVWELMLSDSKVKAGQKIISFAFGPGLTVFGSLMEVCS
jgi:predicted naringenin-chalcone synthase